MALELHMGDVLRLKKPHPCGSHLWRVTRLGADIGMVCQKCNRYILLPRPTLERRLTEIVYRGSAAGDDCTGS